MPQQIAAREQRDCLLSLLAFAVARILAKASLITHGPAVLLKEERGAIIEDGADGKSAAHKCPGALRAETVAVQVLRALIGKLDGERAHKGARGEREDAGKHPLRERE